MDVFDRYAKKLRDTQQFPSSGDMQVPEDSFLKLRLERLESEFQELKNQVDNLSKYILESQVAMPKLRKKSIKDLNCGQHVRKRYQSLIVPEHTFEAYTAFHLQEKPIVFEWISSVTAKSKVIFLARDDVLDLIQELTGMVGDE